MSLGESHQIRGGIRLKLSEKSRFGGEIKGIIKRVVAGNIEERREARFRRQQRVRLGRVKREGLGGRTRSRGINLVVKKETVIHLVGAKTKVSDLKVLVHSRVNVPISIQHGFEGGKRSSRHSQVVLFSLKFIIGVTVVVVVPRPRRNRIFFFLFAAHPNDAVISKDHVFTLGQPLFLAGLVEKEKGSYSSRGKEEMRKRRREK